MNPVKYISRFLRTVFFLVAVFVVHINMAVAGELTDDLKKLEKASVFSHGEIIGQATKNELFAAYQRILTNWTKLDANDLDSLMKAGTPAGKLYAAALVWETNCYRGQPGKMKTGFDQLNNDNTKVMYRSGCCVSEHTVGEIARAFIKDGQFQEFRVSRWCKKPVSEN